MGKKFEVQKEAAQLEDGGYIGIVSEIKYRDVPYEYADIFIQVNNSDTNGTTLPNGKEVKVGYPSFISPTSKFGKMLIRMGILIEVGKEVDPERDLVGKSVKFVVIQQKSNKNNKMYARVQPDSLKPAHIVKTERVSS